MSEPLPRADALLFDFNGTLSDDEPLLWRVYDAMFSARGRPLPQATYVAELAGLSDEEILRRWLGGVSDLRAFVAERVERYRALAANGSTIPETAREAVRYAAARVPVAVVTGAWRAEVEPALEGAGLAGLIAGIAAADDVARCKPDPSGYLLGLELVGGAGPPSAAVAIEDTEAGIAAAKAAGLRCLAVAGTLPPERLAAADALVPRVDVALMRSLLG